MTEEMNVPYEFHRDIIGKGGSNIRKLMDEFDVNISVPPSQDHSEEVKIHGPPSNVARAIEGMKDKVAELEREKEERVCQPLVLVFAFEDVREFLFLHCTVCYARCLYMSFKTCSSSGVHCNL